MTREIDRPNVGVTIDNGHVLQEEQTWLRRWNSAVVQVSALVRPSCCMYFEKQRIQDGAQLTFFPSEKMACERPKKAWLTCSNHCVEKVGVGKIRSLIRAVDVTEVLRTIRMTLFA